MNWTRLTYGTAVLASLIMGISIYYDDSRIRVQTEDIVELLEGVAERQLVLNDAITTSTVTWVEAQWITDSREMSWDGTNLLNGYWTYDGTSNPVPTSYLAPAGTVERTNVFVSTGQWLNAWVPVITNVGRIRDQLYNDFSVSVSDPTYAEFLDGTYTWTSSETGSAGFTEHVWTFASIYGDIHLIATTQDPLHGWMFRWENWDIAWTLRADQTGGSFQANNWYNEYGPLVIQMAGSGGMPGTNITSEVVGTNTIYTTNITAIYHPEFPAYIMTNVANAVGIYNLAATLDYIDGAIGTMVPQFVDHTMISNGTFDVWLAEPANSNATSLPKLSLSNVVARLGSTVGTNISGNTYLLNYPARGTNAALYGGSSPYVTKERLTSRKKILEYLRMTERVGSWWAGESITKDTNSFFPFGIDGAISDDPYTLTFAGWGPAVTTPLTNVAPQYWSEIALYLRFYHYPPEYSPPEWFHTASAYSTYAEYWSTIKCSHNYISNAVSVHGYAREEGTNMYSVGTFSVSATNAISSRVEVRHKNTTYGSTMSVSSVGAPYSIYSYPNGYSQQYIWTNAVIAQRSLGLGPVCIEWEFTRCIP